MALASVDDLAAIGAVPVDWEPSEAETRRATRLLEMAEGLALSYLGQLGVTSDAIEDWTAERRLRLTVWVAEKAGRRLNVSAAPSVDAYGNPVHPMSMMLNRWEKSDLREIAQVPNPGLSTISIDRGYSDLVTHIGSYGVADDIMWDLDNNVVPEP